MINQPAGVRAFASCALCPQIIAARGFEAVSVRPPRAARAQAHSFGSQVVTHFSMSCRIAAQIRTSVGATINLACAGPITNRRAKAMPLGSARLGTLRPRTAPLRTGNQRDRCHPKARPAQTVPGIYTLTASRTIDGPRTVLDLHRKHPQRGAYCPSGPPSSNRIIAPVLHSKANGCNSRPNPEHAGVIANLIRADRDQYAQKRQGVASNTLARRARRLCPQLRLPPSRPAL